MKKNVMMRLASFLLVAVLISTTAISGTYAKYVTSGTGSDSARVAAWGVDVTAEGTSFAEEYDGVSDGNDAADTANVTVRCDLDLSEIDKLVAPGTKGDMAAIGLTGEPEVDVKVTYSADVQLTGWSVNVDKDNDGVNDGEKYYCPLIIYINGTPYYAAGAESADAFAATIEGIVANYYQEYDANTDLSSVSNANLKISWEWPYESVIAGELCDVEDTALGDAAAAGNAATISLEVTCTVTQID